MSSFYFVNIKHLWSIIFKFVIINCLKPSSRLSMNFSTKPGPSPLCLTRDQQSYRGNFIACTDTYLPTQQYTFISSSLLTLLYSFNFYFLFQLIQLQFLEDHLKNYIFPDSFADRKDIIKQFSEIKYTVLEGASRKDALPMKDSAAIYLLSFAFLLPFSGIADLIPEVTHQLLVLIKRQPMDRPVARQKKPRLQTAQ